MPKEICNKCRQTGEAIYFEYRNLEPTEQADAVATVLFDINDQRGCSKLCIPLITAMLNAEDPSDPSE